MNHRRLPLALAILALFAVSTHTVPAVAQTGTLTLPPGYKAELYARDLVGPTHAVFGEDGALYVTQLNGAENAGAGQVLRITEPGATPEVLLDKLFKPTGVAWTPDALYLVAGNSVYSAEAEDDGQYAAPVQLIKDIPFNGRSNGQINIGYDGRLYFQSTGTEGNPDNSGIIYAMKVGTNERSVYASGFKNAYAMTWNPDDGTMYATEIGDRYIPGLGQPVEEVNQIERGAFYGWPYCYLDYQDAGKLDRCRSTTQALATFPPQSTPTGIAYYEDQLIVSLWGVDPRLFAVDPKSGKVTDFARGFARPMALLVDPDGALIVVDIDGGTITRITK